ncbi:MAG: aminotransferase class I/II-fold pyridoxal phosphate-dependent enzyme [Flavobacteriaceae bacterium]
MIKVAERLNHIEEYYFSKKLREVKKLEMDGKPIINMGIGSPDILPPKKISESLEKSLNHKNAHRYQSYKGTDLLRESIKNFYKSNYNVELNSDNNILPLLGSKEGIMHISLAFLNPGDEVLIPDPGYPTYTSVTNIVGAKPIYFDLSEENSWLPDIDKLNQLNLTKVKLMWINYPNMPTGSDLDKVKFKELILFAKQNEILLINDNPYSFILNKNPKSILSIENSIDYCLELNSLSKSFNMSGWRVGMLIGSKQNIDSVLKIKSNMDSGMFYGVQMGAVNALKLDESWFNKINDIYLKRKKIVLEICDILNLSYESKSVGMFVWAKINSNKSSKELTDYLLYEKNIFVAPGFIFGKNGEGYIRFSLCLDEQLIIKAKSRLK